MKHLEETDPIILSGFWSWSSHPDPKNKIYQLTDFIIFQMEEGTIGSAKINGIGDCRDILEITWPKLVCHQERSSGAVHRTVIRVIDENHIEILDDTVHEAEKPVVRDNSGEKWIRKEPN